MSTLSVRETGSLHVGGGMTGTNRETTPDGREGWQMHAPHLVRAVVSLEPSGAPNADVHGVFGNSHALMMDGNSHQIGEHVLSWLCERY